MIPIKFQSQNLESVSSGNPFGCHRKSSITLFRVWACVFVIMNFYSLKFNSRIGPSGIHTMQLSSVCRNLIFAMRSSITKKTWLHIVIVGRSADQFPTFESLAIYYSPPSDCLADFIHMHCTYYCTSHDSTSRT